MTRIFSLHVFLIHLHSQGLIPRQPTYGRDYDCIHCVKIVPTYPKLCFLGIILELKENKGPVIHIIKELGYGYSTSFANPQEVEELVNCLQDAGLHL